MKTFLIALFALISFPAMADPSAPGKPMLCDLEKVNSTIWACKAGSQGIGSVTAVGSTVVITPDVAADKTRTFVCKPYGPDYAGWGAGCSIAYGTCTLTIRNASNTAQNASTMAATTAGSGILCAGEHYVSSYTPPTTPDPTIQPVACILRKDSGVFGCINHSDHESVGVASVTAQSSPPRLKLVLDVDTAKVNDISCGQDEDSAYAGWQVVEDEANALASAAGLPPLEANTISLVMKNASGTVQDPTALGNSGSANIWCYGKVKIAEEEEPDPEPGEGDEVFAATTTTTWGAAGGLTIRNVYNLAGLTVPSFTVAECRVRIAASSTEGIDVNPMYFGQQASSGDAYDFDTGTAKAQAKQATASLLSAATASTQWSDWFAFNWNKTSKLVVSYTIPNNSAKDLVSAAVNSNVTSYYKSGSDAATDNASGYYSVSPLAPLIDAIECRE